MREKLGGRASKETTIRLVSASGSPEVMRGLLTTQSQNGYREQIKKEMLTRLAWKSRYAKLYPSCCDPGSRNSGTEAAQPQQLPWDLNQQLPRDLNQQLPRDLNQPSESRCATAVTGTSEHESHFPTPPPAVQDGEAPPLMRPVSPQTKQALYQDSSHHGKGRRQYLQRRGHIKPEEKFDFPVLSSWEYGWRLGDFTVDYKTPSSAKSSVVKNTFYAKNGVFSSSTETSKF